MNDLITYFIAWTTYGTWLPGDGRGWRKTRAGEQLPQPLLEAWSRKQMTEAAVVLNRVQRQKLEDVCRRHAKIRGWDLHAVNARTNHVHIAVTADPESRKVRDQFTANATQVLRQTPDAISNRRFWIRGGDIEIVGEEDSLEQVVIYINEVQDGMGQRR